MAIDAREHESPVEGEPPRWEALRDLSLSTHDPVPVASLTARDQLLAELATTAYPASASRPLLVYRIDSDTYERYNGTAWRKVAGARSRVYREQADFNSTLIPGATPATVIELVSAPFTLDTAADVRIDLDLVLRADPGNALGWIDVFVDTTKVRARRAESNGVLTMDASARAEEFVAAGAHTVYVRAASAIASSSNMRFNTGSLLVSW